MIIATAFNRNHPQNMEGGIIEEEFQTEYVMDRTNTFGEAFMALSVGCARCHDHKYDPFSQKNYYQLFSFFNNVAEAGQISWNDDTPTPTLPKILTDPCIFVAPFISKIQFAIGSVPTGSPIHKIESEYITFVLYVNLNPAMDNFSVAPKAPLVTP
jgi:hypothetical protein